MPIRRTSRHSRASLPAVIAMVLITAGSAVASEGGGGGSSFDFGTVGQAIVVVIIFLLLLAVLGRWAWKPLVGQLEQREKSIEETIRHAQERQAQAEELLAQYKARLDNANKEAQDLLAKTRQEAVEARDMVITAANTEAHRAGDIAKQDIQRAKLDALNELYTTTATLAADIAGHVLRRNISPDDQKRLVSESLEEIRKKTLR